MELEPVDPELKKNVRGLLLDSELFNPISAKCFQSFKSILNYLKYFQIIYIFNILHILNKIML